MSFCLLPFLCCSSSSTSCLRDSSSQTFITWLNSDDKIFDDPTTPLSRTILARLLYDQLAKLLRIHLRSILLGNPGILKFWFQWYLMYSIANNRNVGPDYFGNTKSPRVVVRQEGKESMTFYFLQSEQAYEKRSSEPSYS